MKITDQVEISFDIAAVLTKDRILSFKDTFILVCLTYTEGLVYCLCNQKMHRAEIKPILLP